MGAQKRPVCGSRSQPGRAFDGTRDEFIDVGLPFGPKPRLVLYHLNAEALRTQSPEHRARGQPDRIREADPGARSERSKHSHRQGAARAAIGGGFSDRHRHEDGRSVTLKGHSHRGLRDLDTTDPQQRVLWPCTVQFSQRYFESLMKHAVPLNETAVARLSHNAMALDIYTWLAQRLHRVEEGKSVHWCPGPRSTSSSVTATSASATSGGSSAHAQGSENRSIQRRSST